MIRRLIRLTVGGITRTALLPRSTPPVGGSDRFAATFEGMFR